MTAQVRRYIRERVLLLRFGCLQREGHAQLTYRAIGQALGISDVAAFQIVKRWRASNHEWKEDNKKRCGRRKKLTSEQERDLVSYETLNKYKLYTLQRRV